MSHEVIHGDCLTVLRGMRRRFDLIYLDPPFGNNKDWAGTAGAFSDRWAWTGAEVEREQALGHREASFVVRLALEIHGGVLASYLLFMAERLLALKRVLKPDGSLYLHCDDTADMYLRLLLDAIFGKRFYRREIVWSMPRPSGFKTVAMNWSRGHDTLFYYAGKGATFNKQYEPYSDEYLRHFNKVDAEGRYWLRSGKKRRLGKGFNLHSCWQDIHSMQTQSISRKEGVGYPTQKPLALLRRIIQASSNEGDVVLDPFCGSGTTLLAAKRLGRNAVGIDRSDRAVEVARGRLAGLKGKAAFSMEAAPPSNERERPPSLFSFPSGEAIPSGR